MYIRTYVCYVGMCMYMYVSTYVGMYVCMDKYIHTHIFIYIYLHKHTCYATDGACVPLCVWFCLRQIRCSNLCTTVT